MAPRKPARSNAEYQGAVVRPDAPDPSWVPLRLAPYRLQAILERSVGLRPRPPRLLERDEISDFVHTAISGADIVKLELNEAGTGLVVTFKTAGYDDITEEACDTEDTGELVPHELRSHYKEPNEETEDFIRKAEAAWQEMEVRLRLAITHSFCHVVARSGSMHAPHFTEISASDFSRYRITDWSHGIAESEAGEKIFSIFLAIPLSPHEAALLKEMTTKPAAYIGSRYLFKEIRN